MSEKPWVAHVLSVYLRMGSNCMYPQIGGLRRYRPLVLCKRTQNLDRFPLDMSEARIVRAFANPLRKFYQRFARRHFAEHFPAFLKALDQLKPRIVHSHFAARGYEELPLKRRCGAAHVVSTYGADIWKHGSQEEWRRKYRILFAESDVFLAEGNAMKAKMVELGCEPEKAVVQHLGVYLDTIDFAPRRVGEDGIIRCLMAGRAVEKKGMEYGIRAVARVARKHPNLRLTMMATGDTKGKTGRIAQLKQVAVDLGIADKITWYGMQPFDVYLRITRDSHLFMSPSVLAADGDAEGGCPLTILELSAAGMPILASEHCDIPEAVIDGVTGYLAPERDVDALSERLEYLVAHPEQWEAMGRAGRAHIEMEYNARAQPAKLETIYDRLI